MINSDKITKFFNKIIKKIYKWRIFNPFRKYLDIIRDKIEKSIRFELMVVIAICFFSSFIFYAISNSSLADSYEDATVVYDYDSIKYEARSKVDIINREVNIDIKNSTFFGGLCESVYTDFGAKAYITDLDGNIIYKSSNVEENTVDIFSLITNVVNEEIEDGEDKKIIFPINLGEERYYFIYSDKPAAEIEYSTQYVDNSFVALIMSIIVFSIIFITITNKKMKYLDEIALGLKIIANDDLSFRIREEGNDEIRNLACNINYMANEINNKIEAERKAEKTKADLITNVSHDLRTPLTSIMGYIGLIKEGKYKSEKEMKEYLDIAFSKSERLKMLIEDLFEYTKFNNDGIKINKTNVNLNEFLAQLSEELMPLFEDENLTLVNNSNKEEKIIVNIDAEKMVRVFENLLTNAIKYSFKPGKVFLNTSKHKGYVNVVIKNHGNNIPKEKVDKLFDRFYRVEESRNTQTGGTGLGLAIAKNIVTLHGGSIWAECYGEEICFYVRLKCE